MKLEYHRITLDVANGDTSGLLVLRDGALVAVASELGEMHGDMAGRWFIETIFHPGVHQPRDPFLDVPAMGSWLDEQLS